MGPECTSGDGRPRPLGARSWAREARRTGNPLLRRATAGEQAVVWLAAALFVLLVLATLVACALTLRNGSRLERAQAADRGAVTATVLGPAPTAPDSDIYLVDTRVLVTYRYAGEDRQGVVVTANGAEAGTTVQVWVDRSGRLTRAPHTRWDTLRDTAVVVLVGGSVLVGLGLAGVAGFDAWRLRRHLAEWDAEWLDLDSGRR